MLFENKDKSKGIVDIIFNVNEGRKSYIRNINISGNTRTLDYVIRRELTILEGDPYNSQELKHHLILLED